MIVNLHPVHLFLVLARLVVILQRFIVINLEVVDLIVVMGPVILVKLVPVVHKIVDVVAERFVARVNVIREIVVLMLIVLPRNLV
jgi:hypothetical protein